MSRIGIYNLYWDTYGGGEQVSGALAEHLAMSHEVTLLGPVRPDAAASSARLGVDLSGCGYASVKNDAEASEASASFDVFVNGTYRSNARNRSARGFYYVHFPEPPPTTRESVRSFAASALFAIVDPLAGDRNGDGTAGRLKRALARRRRDTSWVESYTDFLANSTYTASWIKRLWDVDSTVVYPAVRPVVEGVSPSAKEPLIASIGRFFDPALGHSKKQRDLLSAFALMHEAGRDVASGRPWRLVLVGGADGSSREYVLGVRRAAVGLPVDVLVNRPRVVVEDTLRSASIYWHGAGWDEDPQRHPERFEHFGIALVEAMLAGCVPVVFGEAGPAEIVRHGVDGYHWHTLDKLVEFTSVLMNDPERRAVMAASAVERGREFSLQRFRQAIDAVIV